MDSGSGEPSFRDPQSSAGGGRSQNTDAGRFECNICFDPAQEPVVTLCGHLFCWPCLYEWLHGHSHSSECPVCKAIVVEEEIVPLYSGGTSSTEPQSRSISGLDIPDRPTGRRSVTAPQREQPYPNHYHGYYLNPSLHPNPWLVNSNQLVGTGTTQMAPAAHHFAVAANDSASVLHRGYTNVVHSLHAQDFHIGPHVWHAQGFHHGHGHHVHPHAHTHRMNRRRGPKFDVPEVLLFLFIALAIAEIVSHFWL